MSTWSHRSFAGGEIAPALYARADLSKYSTALKKCKNFIVMRHGGLANRPGTKYVGTVNNGGVLTGNVRLIPFVFNADESYILELGDTYMRVIKDGAYVVSTTKTAALSAFTNATPGVMSTAAPILIVQDDMFQFTDMFGMDELDGQYFMLDVLTGTTFNARHLDESGTLDTTPYLPFTSGKIKKVYTETTPWAEADLFELKFVQSADVMTVVHPDYPPYEISRSADDVWVVATRGTTPKFGKPVTPVISTRSDDGAPTDTLNKDVRYLVAAVDSKTGEQSEASDPVGYNLQDKSADFFYNSTVSGGSYLTFPALLLNDSMVTERKLIFTGHAADWGGKNFFVVGENAAGESIEETVTMLAGTGGAHDVTTATVKKYSYILSISIDSTGPATKSLDIGYSKEGFREAGNELAWNAGAGDTPEEFKVYKSEDKGGYGFIGYATREAATITFVDRGYKPDTSDQPPDIANPFPSSDNYPSATTYYQQRQIFANTNNFPERLWASRTGSFKNFGTSVPLQDDDGVEFQLVGTRVNEIQDLMDMGTSLILFTSDGEWAVQGDSAGTLTPTGINLRQHSGHGISPDLPALRVAGSALFIQARGNSVRDLAFQFQTEGYAGNEVSVMSGHLFDQFSIVDWDYQQIPHSIVWAARSDGVLLGLTYVREQEIFAWHQHDLGGDVESVAVIPETLTVKQDSVYFVVRRTINGVSVRHIERMDTRLYDNIEDFVFSDDSKTHNSALSLCTLTGGSSWDSTETLTCTSAFSDFFPGNAVTSGMEVHFVTGTDTLRCKIESRTSDTVAVVRPQSTVPGSLRGAFGAAYLAEKKIFAGHHLRGEDVSVLGDGFVLSNPNDSSYPTVTVDSDGYVEVSSAVTKAIIGLPIIADVETLDIDTVRSETIADKKSLINKVSVRVSDSVSFWAGAEPPSDDTTDPLENLIEARVRNNTDTDAKPTLATDIKTAIITSKWGTGRVFIRHVNPHPLTILAIHPSGIFPFAREL